MSLILSPFTNCLLTEQSSVHSCVAPSMTTAYHLLLFYSHYTRQPALAGPPS